jgi:hypothetical protein
MGQGAHVKVLRFAMVALLGLAALGCSGDDDDDDAQQAPLEVIGEWESTFGDETFEEIITDEKWGFANLVEYDNAKNVAITQNPDDDSMFANTYSRIVWLEPKDDAFYYCTTDYGLETLEEAQEADTEADDSDPDTSGCGMFAWSKLTAK